VGGGGQKTVCNPSRYKKWDNLLVFLRGNPDKIIRHKHGIIIIIIRRRRRRRRRRIGGGGRMSGHQKLSEVSREL
jgi:hypothetical protein